MTPFTRGEKLRREPRRRTHIVVGIVDIVRVELELVVVEVEVRRTIEVAIRIGILPLPT
jgi:hypothetical protein